MVPVKFLMGRYPDPVSHQICDWGGSFSYPVCFMVGILDFLNVADWNEMRFKWNRALGNIRKASLMHFFGNQRLYLGCNHMVLWSWYYCRFNRQNTPPCADIYLAMNWSGWIGGIVSEFVLERCWVLFEKIEAKILKQRLRWRVWVVHQIQNR